MTDPETNVGALIARLEAVTGPDRRLDIDIGFALDIETNWAGDLRMLGYRDDSFIALGAQPYTASIDAALTLVREDHFLEHLGQEPGGWTAKISDKIDDRLSWEAVEFPTAGAAISGAALRARSALAPEGKP
jgi:hypothetical protein